MIKYTVNGDLLRFTVKVAPRASRSESAGEHDGALKIRVAAPPVDGAANEELVKTLAREFSVSKRFVRIISGQTGKVKQIEIEGADLSILLKLAGS